MSDDWEIIERLRRRLADLERRVEDLEVRMDNAEAELAPIADGATIVYGGGDRAAIAETGEMT